MNWPANDSPFWKILQGLVSLGFLLALVYHGESGGHAGGVDAKDVVGGGVSAGLAGKLVMDWLRS